MVMSRRQNEINNVLEQIDKKEECVMCKFALIFAFLVLLIVVVLVFVLRSDQSTNQPLPPEKAPQISPAAWNQHVLELGKAIHPELTAPASGDNTLKDSIAVPSGGKTPLTNSSSIKNK